MTGIKIFKQNISDKENSDKFILKTKQNELGYAYIYHGENINNIYIFIVPEYRSNGYGSFLFSYILKEIKNSKKYPHFTFDIEKENIHANNIIAKSGGLLLSEDTKKHWILKL